MSMFQLFSTTACIIDSILILAVLKFIVDDSFFIKRPWLVISLIVILGCIGGFFDAHAYLFIGNAATSSVKTFFPLLIYFLNSKGRIIRKCSRFFVALLYYISISMLSGFLEMIFMTEVVMLEANNTQFLIFTNIVNTLAIFLLYHFCNKKKIHISFSRMEWVLLFGVNMVAFILLDYYGIVEETDWTGNTPPEIIRIVINHSVLYAVTFLYLFFIVSLVTGKIARHFRKVGQLTQEHMQQQLEYFKVYRTTQEETRQYKHDIKNHFLYLNTLVRDDKTEEMKEYISSLSDQWENLTQLIRTGNDVIDTIIYGKSYLFEQNHINLTVEGMFVSDLHVEPVDLCTIFTNAIDNAVEANIKSLDDADRYIRINIKSSRNHYLIVIENPISGQLHISNNHISTDKEDEYHGYGLKNIKQSIIKYGGSYLLKTTPDSVFVLELIVPK